MTDLTPRLQELHSTYCRVTKRQLPMTSRHMWAWEMWLSHQWTEADLKLVVQHIWNLIKKDRRRPESFRFHNLIEDTSRFEEDLCEARALYRTKPVDPGKADVLKATHRPLTAPTTPPRTAGDVIRGNEELRRLLALRDSL